MKISCFCLFNTVLNTIFQITDVPFNLNTVCRFLDDPQLSFCLVIVIHESLAGPEQFNCLLFFRKIIQLLRILWVSSIFCIFEPFTTVTV